MPKNKFQDVIFTFLMAAVMVYGMVCYNISLETGGLRDEVFAMALGEWPIMTLAAILLELIIVGRLSKVVAFRLVSPAESGPTPIMLGRVRLDDVPVHEPARHPAVQGRHPAGRAVHLDPDHLPQLPHGAHLAVLFCRPARAPHFRPAVP